MWEEWDASPELYPAFQQLTAEQLLAHPGTLRQAAIAVASDCPEVLAQWQQLLVRLHELADVSAAVAVNKR